jgi:hypothetical protein
MAANPSAEYGNEGKNDYLDEEFVTILYGMERPVHNAYISGKVLCPKDVCVEKFGFFEQNGIDHHFRMKHNAPFTKNDRDDSLIICRKLHEKETKKCLETIFRCREGKVCIFF